MGVLAWSWKKLVLHAFPFTFPVNSSSNTTYPIIASRLSCPVPFWKNVIKRELPTGPKRTPLVWKFHM